MSHSKTARSALIAAGLAAILAVPANAAELDGPASIVFDQFRVPTIVAQTEHDAIYLQGYMHAKDRFFQMDYQRRLFSGQLSELLGPAAIPTDVQLRTFGLRRAAERSLPVQSPETTAWLQAYSDGVNAFLTDTTQSLPLEYSLLELDRDGIPLWTPTDSLTIVKGIAFGLSFDLGDIDRTLALLSYVGVGDVLGFFGLNLYQRDLWPTRPFDLTTSIPNGAPSTTSEDPPEENYPGYISDPNFATMVQSYRDTIADIPLLNSALNSDFSEMGSNWWVVSGDLTESGFPMLTNDPHLMLDTPATFYEIHLNAADTGLNVTGVSFPGAPGIVQGCNDTICWGSTVNPLDVTDVYNEVLVPLDPSQPTTPTHTLRDGVPEPLQFIPQTFLFNAIGDGVPNTLFDAGVPADQGGVTLVVPRRNNGPIVNITVDLASPTPITGLSVAYTGWSATQELECFRLFARAGSMQDFKDALQFFDVGSQNWAYADVNGNIAYYTSAELPIREDLQLFFGPDGFPIGPWLIRDGTHASRHEWFPLQNPQPGQALSTEILPFDEMPQIENPSRGYILNANNDPIGTLADNISWNQFRANFNGALYLSESYAAGYRIGRIQRLFDDILAGGGKLSQAESIAIQANNQLLDAEVLTPHLLESFTNAAAPGAPPELAALAADPRIAEAAARLADWDFSTPTGINEGFDPGDNPAAPGPPSAAEVDASIASTVYAVWRGQIVQRVIDGTLGSLPIPLTEFAPGSTQSMIALRQFLDDYPTKGGTGSSLLNFFTVPGVTDAFVARDLIMLGALQSGLDLLASDDFAPAFDNSTDLADYRWGKLHRIVYAHPLGPALSIPPTGSPLNLAPDLPGISRAGGMGAVDASAHSARADGLNEFMFSAGPNRRVVATMTPDGPEVLQIIPGGQSGAPGSPFQIDQLVLWLVNAFHPLPVSLVGVNAIAVETQTLECGDGTVGPGEECDDGNTDENDGCNQACEQVPIITCLGPSVDADPDTCDASVSCDAIATCSDPDGGAASVVCAPTGPYTAGTTDVGVTCGATMTTCQVAVVDTVAPTLSLAVSPDTLWPPNHRMVEITAQVSADDNCSTATFTLDSVTSNEPDDAPGDDDGDTIDDIQDEEVGTDDVLFSVRAERAGEGDGRTYTVTYTATDAFGNTTSESVTVFVPHDQSGKSEPVLLSMTESAAGTVIDWPAVFGADSFNVIRASLDNVKDLGFAYNLGNVTCLESGSLDESTVGHEDPAIPEPGKVFVYFVEFVDGTMRSSYGTVTAAKPREPRLGNCQ